MRLLAIVALSICFAPAALAPLSARAQDAEQEEVAPGGAMAPPVASASPVDSSEALSAPDREQADSERADSEQERADSEQAEAVEEPAPAPPRPYRGSIFGWQQGMTVNTLNPSAQLTYDPTYYWSFFLQPRWYVDPQNFFVATLGAGIEFTNSNFTAHEQEFQLGDLALEWRHTEAVEGFIFITSTRLAAPTSLASIAAQRIANVGGGVTAVRVFPEAASFTIALAGGARYWLAASNTPGVAPDTAGYRCTSPGGVDSACSQTSAVTSEQLRLMSSLSVSVMPAAGLTLSMQYAFGGIMGYGVGTASNPAIGGPPTIGDPRHHWRPITYWTVAAAYDVLPWLNLALGYQSASVFNFFWNDGGNATNVFYNPESELYLTVTLAIDGVIEAIEGGEEDGLTPEERQRRRQGLSAAPAAQSRF